MTVDDREWNMVDLAVYISSKELVTENLWREWFIKPWPRLIWMWTLS